MFSISTGSVSGRECKIGQKDLLREDRKRDNEDPTAGNYQDCKESYTNHVVFSFSQKFHYLPVIILGA